jgi:NAD(P)-dependent dehydrogenase (short-subunit alcohol dehydrogenase family)
VLLASRTEEGGVAAGRLAAEGLDVGSCRLDVANADSITTLADQLRREAVSLDVLVNNAGIAMDGFDADVARRTLAVNFFGAMHVTGALLLFLRDGGNVVMVSSGLGEVSCLVPALRARFLDPRLSRAALAELMTSFIRAVERGRHADAGWPTPRIPTHRS